MLNVRWKVQSYFAAEFKIRKRKENSPSYLHVLNKTLNLVIHVVVVQGRAKKCAKIYFARAEPLFC